MSNRIYCETFDNGPGGWYGFIDNFQGIKTLPTKDGLIMSYSPWWVDYNHAPPGAGYLNLLMGLCTKGPFADNHRELAGENNFVNGNYPTNFVDAQITVRVKGEIELRNSHVCLLVQAVIDGICSGWLLMAQPIDVTPDWSQQTITAVCDPTQWKPLGSRYDRVDMYGTWPLDQVLADVNTNMYFALHPLDVAPMGPIDGDPHILLAGRDYPLWRSRLPEGYAMFDTVKIEFA